jgi:hypothetical protein
MRSNAKREVETLKANVDRELAERKLVALREVRNPNDLEHAISVVTEQARLDLELELTARRAEAEAEYMQKHKEAVAATQKYLDDATAQLSLALTRSNAAKLEAETLQAAAISITQQVTNEARRKADGIIAAAEAEARNLVSSAAREAEARIAAAQEQIQKLEAQRESVEVYLHNLRHVLNRGE